MPLDNLTTTQIIISGVNSLATKTTTPEVMSVSMADQLAAWLHSSSSNAPAITIEATRARNTEVLNRFLQK